MIVVLLQSIALLLQGVAAILALRLISVTGKTRAWLLIAAAITLIVIRRSFTFFPLLVHPPTLTLAMLVESLLLLAISICLVLGIAAIPPLFLAIQRSEEALRATERLRSEFVAFAAHELRNPASAIKTAASVLREPGLPADARAQVIDAMTRSADALMRLVLNILDMGRIEEGRLLLHQQPVSLATLVDELIAELEPSHPGLHRHLIRELPPVLVNVDADYIKLVLANLLDNALKFSPQEAQVTLTGAVHNRMVVVQVRDGGAGIPPEMVPRLFEKYATTIEAPRRQFRGVGLGLYMARLLVEAHGGQITAESKLGEGTTISFTLPIVSEALPP